jgi:arylsulfatase A
MIFALRPGSFTLYLLVASIIVCTNLLGKPATIFAQTEHNKELPNILILYADDLGYGDLHCYNADSKIPTPNLDQLAKQGMRFTDAHSSSGICSPSRYALLTGRHHWRDFHGIVGPMGASKFKPERLTMPEMLKQQGYRTGAIGKWHLGWNWDAIRKPNAERSQDAEGKNNNGKNNRFDAFDWSKRIPDGPLDHGFDYYFGDTVINFPPYCWIENDRVVGVPDTMMETGKWKKIKEGNWECRPGPMISSWDPYQNIPTTTKKGVEFIKACAERPEPFFLYFAFPSPHAPIIPNDRFDGKSGAGPFGDFVVETDHAIGQLLQVLEESGQADNTIVIFSADNGPEQYAYARDQNFDHWSAHPLRGLKRDIYEGGHRVPMIVRYPGIVPADSVCKNLVSQVDIMATLAAITDFQLPDENCAEDSFNILPLWKGSTEPVRTTLVHNTKKDHYAIRHLDWLLVDGKDGYISRRNDKWEQKRGYPSDDEGQFELYNLANDISQKQNLATANPQLVKSLANTLHTIRTSPATAPRLVGKK